jgi:hypothetical protein
MMELCPSHPTILFKLCRRRFPIKIAFAVKINKAQKQKLNLLHYIHPRLFFFHAQLRVASSISFSFGSVVVAVIEGH